MALYQRVLGSRRPSMVAVRIQTLHEQATQDRRYRAQLDALEPDEAVQLIQEHATQAEAQRPVTEEGRKAAEARAARLRQDNERRGKGRAATLGDACSAETCEIVPVGGRDAALPRQNAVCLRQDVRHDQRDDERKSGRVDVA